MFTVVLSVFTMIYLEEKIIGNICNIAKMFNVNITIIVKTKYDGTYNIRNNANL